MLEKCFVSNFDKKDLARVVELQLLIKKTERYNELSKEFNFDQEIEIQVDNVIERVILMYRVGYARETKFFINSTQGVIELGKYIEEIILADKELYKMVEQNKKNTKLDIMKKEWK